MGDHIKPMRGKHGQVGLGVESTEVDLEKMDEIGEKEPKMKKALELAREFDPIPASLYLSICYALAIDPRKNSLCEMRSMQTGERVPADILELGEIGELELDEFYAIYVDVDHAAQAADHHNLRRHYPPHPDFNDKPPVQATPLMGLVDRVELETAIDMWLDGEWIPDVVHDLESLHRRPIYLNEVPVVEYVCGGIRHEWQECTCTYCQVNELVNSPLGALAGMVLGSGRIGLEIEPANKNEIEPDQDPPPDFLDMLGGGPVQ